MNSINDSLNIIKNEKKNKKIFVLRANISTLPRSIIFVQIRKIALEKIGSSRYSMKFNFHRRFQTI